MGYWRTTPAGRLPATGRPNPLLALLAVAAVAPACAGDEGPAPPVTTPVEAAFTVRDSSGVRIAESADSSWTRATAWWVEAEPFVQIGTRTGEEAGSALGRVATAVRLSDGRIAVADQQALEIRVFAAGGTFLGSWGRRGQGPGEFQRLDNLAVLNGDSLVARDDGAFRHVIFGPDGTFGRTVNAPPLSWRSTGGVVAGWLGDGSFLVGPPAIQGAQLVPGRQLIEGEWHGFDPSGAHLGLVATLPERLVEGRGTPLRGSLVSYGPRAQSATGRTGLWHGYPATFELRHVSSGGVDWIVRRAWTGEAVTGALADGYRTWFEAGRFANDVSETIRSEYVTLRREASWSGEAPVLVFPDTLPAFRQVIVSRDDHLWVEAYATAAELHAGGPEAVATGRWTVFDPEGRWLGTVALPLGLRVTEIGADYVLGVWLDDLDVPFVRLHRIVKPPA